MMSRDLLASRDNTLCRYFAEPLIAPLARNFSMASLVAGRIRSIVTRAVADKDLVLHPLAWTTTGSPGFTEMSSPTMEYTLSPSSWRSLATVNEESAARR